MPKPFRRPSQLRATDFDRYGHLNQSVYHQLLEDGRIGFVDQLGLPGLQFVVARVELDYRREILPAEAQVEIEIGLSHLGRSSFTLSQKIFKPDGELAAEGVVVLVTWDGESRSSRPLSEEERAKFSA